VEHLALLHHFLHRCITKGLSTDTELHLFVELKLNTGNTPELAAFNGTGSDALRQQLKCLLARFAASCALHRPGGHDWGWAFVPLLLDPSPVSPVTHPLILHRRIVWSRFLY